MENGRVKYTCKVEKIAKAEIATPAVTQETGNKTEKERQKESVDKVGKAEAD